MKGIFIALALGIILLLSFGCPGQDNSPKKTYKCEGGSLAFNESDCPNTAVAEPVVRIYTCPDGKNVTNLSNCKKEEPAAPPVILTDAQKRAIEIEKVNNISGMINFDRQALLNVAAVSETATTQGCREYYGYYQLIGKRMDANYAAYLDELGKLAALFGENQDCMDAIASGKQLMAETWKDAYLKSAVVLATCSEPESRRDWIYDHQVGETFYNSTARLRDNLGELDRSLAASCERVYGAINPANGTY
jgi:hypothetical protein